jgi:hypothetical protein
MLVLYFLLKRNVTREEKATVRASAAALVLTLAGYFFIYLITPRDIYWHLRFSLNRLFVQLWPSAIFVFFSALGCEPLTTRRGDTEPQVQQPETASQNGTKSFSC